MKLKVEVGYPDYAELYMGTRIGNSQKYPAIDRNCARSKYSCQILFDIIIVITRVNVKGKDYMIDYR